MYLLSISHDIYLLSIFLSIYHLSVSLSIFHLSISLSIYHLSTSLSIYLLLISFSIYLLLIHPSFYCLLINSSIYRLSIHPSIYRKLPVPTVYQSIQYLSSIVNESGSVHFVPGCKEAIRRDRFPEKSPKNLIHNIIKADFFFLKQFIQTYTLHTCGEDGTLTTTVYRKPSGVGRWLKADIGRYKASVIRSFIRRVFKNYSRWEVLHQEPQRLPQVLVHQ